MYVDLLNILSFNLNFTYTIKQPKDMSYGQILDDGSWNGIIGELQRRNADVGLCGLAVTEERSKVVDFTVGVNEAGCRLWMLIPKRSFSWTTFVASFSEDYWIVLVSVTAGLSIVLFTSFLFVKNEATIDAGTSVTTVCLSLVGFGIPIGPKRVPGRILVFTVTLIFGALNFWAYNAQLISLLTAETHVYPIRSMKDLAENSNYNLIVKSGNCHGLKYYGLIN